MKPILAILVLTVAVSLDVGAQDVRSRVGPPVGTSVSNIIDPDKSIYGVQWGSSEDDFISRVGSPTGYVRLNGSDTAMLYGKSHAFIFTASKLSGLRISMTMLDWKLSQALLTLTAFDGIRWQLSNGLRAEMNLAEVKKILGERLKTDRFQCFFNSDKVRVELDFYRLSTEGEKDEAYRLSGVYIRQASSASGALQKAPASVRPLYAQVPEATQPCTAEVAKWWQEVRLAAGEVCDAKKRATAKERFRRLLAEGQAKSYRAPIEDSAHPVVIYTDAPRYTEEARRKKTQGKVNMQVEFRRDGTIGDVNVVTGLGDGLDEQAIKTIRQIVFLPGVKDGMFVTISKVTQAEFNLR